jgi:TonB family protein
MKLDLELEESVAEPAMSEPAFLVELEPRPVAFFRNLRDLFWTPRQPPLNLLSWPAAPWPDVFVPTRLPWGGVAGSALAHIAAVVAVVSLVRLFPDRPAIVDHPVISHNDVIYYTPAEYLAQLDTGSAVAEKPQQGDPEFAPQSIISVPPHADNHVQTIVTPPNVKLDRDMPLPNIVAWSQTPQSVPLGATTRNAADLRAPALAMEVVAPTPEVGRSLDRQPHSLVQTVVAPAPEVSLAANRQVLQAPQAAVVAPAPQVNAESIRKLGDLNIGHSDVVAPAPQLPTAERSVAARVGPLSGGSAAVPPPPSVQVSGSQGGGGRVIALNVRPLAPNASAEIPQGNRRGSFAATPEGNPGARGTPQILGKGGNVADTGKGSGSTVAGAGKSADAPPGLFVGAAPRGSTTGVARGGSTQLPSDNTGLMASVTPPRVSSLPPHTTTGAPVDNPTPLDRQVFGDRKFYRMNINVPNLNSSGGSWIVRFAPLKGDDEKGEVSSPVATRTADPGYPLELMRHNVQGTVTLYAVIHRDGSVSGVKVLQSVDDRLDEFASAALARWKFLPATRNGNPVELETVVVIPFRPSRASF